MASDGGAIGEQHSYSGGLVGEFSVIFINELTRSDT